jgi:hypothetical protein
MQILRRLFGGVFAARSPSRGQDQRISLQPPEDGIPPTRPRPDDGWSTYFDLGSLGADGTYLATIRSDTPSTIGTGRISGGRHHAIAWGGNDYAILASGRVVFVGQLRGVDYGDIADSGTYVLGTGTAEGQRLHGRFVAFDPQHSVVLEDRFAAMVFNVAISPDGRHAVCQTCNGNTRGGLLSIYDIDARSRILQEETGSRWANSYTFDRETASLRLHFRDGAVEQVALDGQLRPRHILDGESTPTASSPYDDFWQAESAYQTLPETGSVEEGRLAIIESGFRRALTGDMTDRKRAEAYRRLGELALRRGDTEAAIRAWKSAIAWLPGIGVAKKLKALERDASNASSSSPSPREEE